MIGATYTFKAKELEWREVAELVGYRKSAIDTYQEMLKSISIEDDPTVYSDAQKKIGDIHWELSQYRDKKENCKKAIKAYEEALKVYVREGFPEIHKLVKHNLRNVLDFCGDKIKYDAVK